ncbi:hypothetical protein MKX03_013148, partial [Papaver bracteatum]
MNSTKRTAILTAAAVMNSKVNLIAKYDDGSGLAKTVMSVKDDNGIGVIHFAAVEGKLNVLKYLIEELKLDVNMKDLKGRSPLLHATVAGHMNVVEYLLGQGADPKTSDPKGYSPLHCAGEKGYTDILTKLLSRGVDVNGASENGTPLAHAAAHGRLEAIQILLENNANPDLCSGRSFTPLTGSIVSGLPQSLRCVELLLE